MKKVLISVLGTLLVLPVFAEIAPIFYDEVIEYAEDVDTEPVVEEVAAEEVTVVTPVVQPSRTSPRGVATSNRAASRAVASKQSATNARAVSSRSTSASRNAAQARTATSRSALQSRNAVSTNARVASRPTRGASVGAKNAKTVASRSAARTNAATTARAGALTQTDTVTTPLYTGRVGVRSSSAIQARMPSAMSLSSRSSTVATSTEEKASAISDMDDLAQMTDYCKAQYTSCMDNFCNVLDDNQGRCSCSKNIKNYEKTEVALKAATEALQDIAQQIQYIGLTADDINTLFTQTEAEIAMQSTTDSTQLKNDLDNIKDMIVGIKTGTASSTETGMSFDLSGLLDFNINSTGFDLTGLFGGNTANTSSISNQRGEQLYKTAAARCKASVLTSCQAQGVDISVITNSYDLEIDKQCIAYERSLTDSNENMNQTVRNAKVVLQKARLMVAQQKNAYDLRGCVNALDSCMQDDFVCGTDYENCLDPTGKYIVNGEVVIGSAPGYFVSNNDTQTGVSADTAAPIQHTTGLYATWNYLPKNGTGTLNAWYTDDENNPTSLSGYIANSISEKPVTEIDSNLVSYLQYKIGYVLENKTYGMCASVLNKCQNYTYKDGEFQNDNQVVREFLQRTLTQIKVAQDEIVSSYAENCISDVDSCLSTNKYNISPNAAMNACKAQIVTCMSVNGFANADPKPDAIKNWVDSMQNGETKGNIKYILNGLAKLAPGFQSYATAEPGVKLVTPSDEKGLLPVGDDDLGSLYWCYRSGPTKTECNRTTTGISETKTAAAILAGNVYLSITDKADTCDNYSGTWTDGIGCVCGSYSSWNGSTCVAGTEQ